MTITQKSSDIKKRAAIAIEKINEKLQYKQLLILEAREVTKNKQWKKLNLISKKYDVLEDDIASQLDELLGNRAGENFKNNLFKRDVFGSPFKTLDARCDSISAYLIALREELKTYPEQTFQRWSTKKTIKATFTSTNTEIIVQIGNKGIAFQAGTNMFLLCKAMKRTKTETPMDWGVVYYRMFQEEANIKNKRCWKTIYNAVERINNKVSEKLEQNIKLFKLKQGQVIRLF